MRRRRRTAAALRPDRRTGALLARAADCDTAIVLTAPRHERDPRSLVERLGLPVYAAHGPSTALLSSALS